MKTPKKSKKRTAKNYAFLASPLAQKIREAYDRNMLTMEKAVFGGKDSVWAGMQKP